MLNITITAYPHSWDAHAICPYIFPAFEYAAVLLIGSFCSANPPPIMLSSRVPWYSHQPMNGVWKELTPPSRSPMYLLLISCHATLRKNIVA